MAKSGPIFIIDDDIEDHELIAEILKEIGVENEILYFERCLQAFEYLTNMSNDPFIIFCDVNIPLMNGIDFKRMIDKDENLKKKSIPFVFYTTAANQELVNKAYTTMTVQGFFEKGNNYNETKSRIKLIVDYWSCCKHPNSF